VSRARVLVADALPIFRVGVRNLLRREGDFEVVEASSYGEVVDALAGVDVALVDVDLPPRGGVDAVARLRGRTSARLIVWSLEPTPDDVLAAVRAGSHGFLRKDMPAQGLVRALRGAQHGEAPLSRELTTLLIEALHGLDELERARTRVASLSQREREVLAHLARGARNKDIAVALVISEFTVKRHVQNILHKLGLPSRHAAASFHELVAGRKEAALAGP